MVKKAKQNLKEAFEWLLAKFEKEEVKQKNFEVMMKRHLCKERKENFNGYENREDDH